MSDHDQRFKLLLREFFVEFLSLFFPRWAERFDFNQIDWLDKEVFTDLPQGERRSLDLVAKLPTRQAVPLPRGEPGQSWIALVHVEIESADSVEPLRHRMFEYYELLRRRYQLPVFPIGLYLRVGLEGVGWDLYEEYFWEQRLLCFEYAYVGLPALDAEEYVRRENILAVALAALMRVQPERKAWLKEQALQRLAASQENDARRFLLFECVDAYLPLSGPQAQDFEGWLNRDDNQGVLTMATTYYERGILQGQRRTLQKQLEERFGPLSPDAQQRIQILSPEELDKLTLELLKAKSLRELGLEDGIA